MEKIKLNIRLFLAPPFVGLVVLMFISFYINNAISDFFMNIFQMVAFAFGYTLMVLVAIFILLKSFKNNPEFAQELNNQVEKPKFSHKRLFMPGLISLVVVSFVLWRMNEGLYDIGGMIMGMLLMTFGFVTAFIVVVFLSIKSLKKTYELTCTANQDEEVPQLKKKKILFFFFNSLLIILLGFAVFIDLFMVNAEIKFQGHLVSGLIMIPIAYFILSFPLLLSFYFWYRSKSQQVTPKLISFKNPLFLSWFLVFVFMFLSNMIISSNVRVCSLFVGEECYEYLQYQK